MAERPSDDEILRQFESMIAGMDLSQLTATVSDLMNRPTHLPLPARPRLRKEPLPEPMVFRIRIDLDDAHPPIWRRLDMRSDLTLDLVHRTIQAAFGWLDYHLYRFSLGRSPFDMKSELFLCDYDVEDGEDEGTSVNEVRLDETLHQKGDVLRYVYDYGDDWALTLRLEHVEPASADTPPARCIGGRRAAPPEDCGHLVSADELATVLDDPAHFDADEINAALSDPPALLAAAGVHPRLAEILYRLQGTDLSGELTARAARLLAGPVAPPSDELAATMYPFTWFLQRAEGEGLPLTAAGYLKPADVTAASDVVPRMRHWIGTKNREVQCAPLLNFRESLQHLGLLRKFKGRLILTKAGAKVVDNPAGIANHIAERLIPAKCNDFELDATLLLLFYAATTDDGTMSLSSIASALTELDWQTGHQTPVQYHHLYRLAGRPYDVLSNLCEPTRLLQEPQLSATAIALSHNALTGARLG